MQNKRMRLIRIRPKEKQQHEKYVSRWKWTSQISQQMWKRYTEGHFTHETESM
jgi:hypothetical protein